MKKITNFTIHKHTTKKHYKHQDGTYTRVHLDLRLECPKKFNCVISLTIPKVIEFIDVLLTGNLPNKLLMIKGDKYDTSVLSQKGRITSGYGKGRLTIIYKGKVWWEECTDDKMKFILKTTMASKMQFPAIEMVLVKYHRNPPREREEWLLVKTQRIKEEEVAIFSGQKLNVPANQAQATQASRAFQQLEQGKPYPMSIEGGKERAYQMDRATHKIFTGQEWNVSREEYEKMSREKQETQAQMNKEYWAKWGIKR